MLNNGGHSSGPRSSESSNMTNHGNLQRLLFISPSLHLLHPRLLLRLHKQSNHQQTQQKRPQRSSDRAPNRDLPPAHLPLQRHQWRLHHQPEVAVPRRHAHIRPRLVPQAHLPILTEARTQRYDPCITTLRRRRVAEVYRDRLLPRLNPELRRDRGGVGGADIVRQEAEDRRDELVSRQLVVVVVQGGPVGSEVLPDEHDSRGAGAHARAGAEVELLHGGAVSMEAAAAEADGVDVDAGEI